MSKNYFFGDAAYNIIKNGKKVTWTEKAYDRDGWEYNREVSGYEYEGKRYLISYDPWSGWEEAREI
jgi:hypothetical protein